MTNPLFSSGLFKELYADKIEDLLPKEEKEMQKFKDGDKIKCIGMCIEYGTVLEIGKIYTFNNYNKSGDWLYIKEAVPAINGRTVNAQYEVKYFELAKEEVSKKKVVDNIWGFD